MFAATEYAECLMKIVHFMVSSYTQLCVSRIAYLYFKKDQMRAQMVAFMLLSAHKVEYQMFNDQFAVLFIVMAIQALTIHKSTTESAVWLGTALSIKAPAILIFPAYFGVVHYSYGLVSLLTTLSIVIGLQVAVAAPFIFRCLGG